HSVAVDHPDYVQIHPTVLYTNGRGRRFLISESVRGEGAQLIDASGERFVDELLPRDVVTAAIRKKMQQEGSEFVRLDMRKAGNGQSLEKRFPSIVKRCREEGYDVMKEPIPVVPAQHYFMGGVRSDLCGRTTMNRLYAVGETCCNGVHGKNRLASNSLLESLVFAQRAAEDIAQSDGAFEETQIDWSAYADIRALQKNYRKQVTKEINREE
ncbi:MAG: FAD-binding protein, partial [Clostridiales bacterium]|nr:FAD-binding protein [Clostridiales bacterium]